MLHRRTAVNRQCWHNRAGLEQQSLYEARTEPDRALLSQRDGFRPASPPSTMPSATQPAGHKRGAKPSR